MATKTSEGNGLLDPREISRLGDLEIIAARVVEGYMAGMHRSPFKGLSIEFAQHRPYTVGDELRMIDWRVYGRCDRHYIKQYDEETNMQAMVVVDGSGSMEFGLSTVTKLRYAQMAAAALARLILQQRDAIGLTTFNTRICDYLPPRSKASYLRAMLNALERMQPQGETSIGSILDELSIERQNGVGST